MNHSCRSRLRRMFSALLVLCLILSAPVVALADGAACGTAAAEAAVADAVDSCDKAQKVVDLIVDLAIEGEYADMFKGSSTSSAFKSMAIDMIVDELDSHEELMIEFGFEPTDENKQLVAEEIYYAACIYYDELHRDGGSETSANKLTVIELIRFALVESRGYSEADAKETSEFYWEINEVNTASGNAAAVEYALSVLGSDHNFVDGVCTECGETEPQQNVTRIYGDNRCATAYAAADVLKEALNVQAFNAVIIASGNNFADALAGSYLAAVKSAPILLYRDGFADDNLDYIKANLASGGTVYILGGTAAVPQEMEDVLKNAGISVSRLYGNSRFDTNLKILEAAGTSGKEILIATGWNFADSLSASATGLPILMVNSNSGELTENQIAFLKENKGSAFTIIGGTSAVSEELKAAIEEVIGKSVGRVFGNSREATSVKVAEKYFPSPDYVLLAYSRNFPDGLCGGPVAYAMGAPLLLINSGKEADAAAYCEANGITSGAALGGTAVVTDESIAVVFGK